MTIRQQLEKVLPLVEKPGRYIGGELHSIIKKNENIKTHFGFAFPDAYEIGMSYLGLQIIYKVLNDLESVFCERLFAPALDMEEIMRKEEIPLFTIETATSAKDLDLIGFTLQYELCYTNVVNMLDLASIPFESKDRNEDHPFIIAGGPCAFNPEPLADIVDFFVIGDGEEILAEICNAHGKWKDSKGNRNDFMLTISKLPGVYVPAFYDHIYEDDGGLSRIDKKTPFAEDHIKKRIVADLDKAPFPTKPIVPFVEIVHDRASLELFRGCTRGCRFCQAGMIYRPVRERSVDCALDLIREQIKNTGHDELSLLSLSTGDYSNFEDLALQLVNMGKKEDVAISLPSLRLDSFSFKVLDEIQGYKKTGLTFAPEAGTQRLRNVINKNITDSDIYGCMKQAIELGWNSIKLYFMIGLPTETYEDLDGIVETSRNIMELYYSHSGRKKGGRFGITISASNFVPKPHTPFQWASQDSPEQFKDKHYYLKDRLRKIRGVKFTYHDTGASEIEAVLARGDRRLSKVVIRAWEKGCKFDGWREYFKYENWVEAMREIGIDPGFYTSGEVSCGKILPWSLIDSGVSNAYLLSEWSRALSESLTKDCRAGCTGCSTDLLCPNKEREAHE